MDGREAEALAREVAAAWRSILGDKLWGVYLHGSLAFGCFHPVRSDIDLILVVRQPLTLPEKEALLRVLLDREERAPAKGFEMSAVLLEHCRSFRYPTPFELHYSISHRARCLADLHGYCAEMQGEDPDLAAHFTVIRAVGRVLCGRLVAETFGEVPHEAYLDSIRADVREAAGAVLRDPVYGLLNLCRVLAFQEEGLVLSKEQGGLWGLRQLPEVAAPVEWALAAYRGSGETPPDHETLRFAAGYMAARLKL